MTATNTASPPRRLPAKSFLSDMQLAEVRTKQTWRGVWMVVHAWTVIIAAVALVACMPNPLTFLLAVAVIGSRQLGLAILMHEGAHGLLSPNERINHRLSQWFCAWPVLAETRAYRRYHLKHHAHTQTEHDPDLILSKPFPITEASYRRKLVRDLTGQSGYEQRKAQLRDALGDPSLSWSQRVSRFATQLGPQVATQVVVFALCALAGIWWAFPLLWVLPLLTWYQVVTRIRNIAEHAVVSDSDDPLRNTRTTVAGWFERAFIAPYFVNYHLEHHLVFYVPAYNLPRVHALLMASSLSGRVEVERGYAAVLRKATARPPAQDRPGELASIARRRQAGQSAGDDQIRGGF